MKNSVRCTNKEKMARGVQQKSEKSKKKCAHSDTHKITKKFARIQIKNPRYIAHFLHNVIVTRRAHTCCVYLRP